MKTVKELFNTEAKSHGEKRFFRKMLLPLFFILYFVSAASAAPQTEIGSVVALKGTADIARGGKKIEAKVKTPLQMADAVHTGAGSRIKMLFIDDSVLTLADNSKMAIKEFFHSKGDRGKSIFNLLDGKMRAVVGKTKFEVQTPTAVAAARGTVIFFETGVLDGRRFTRIVCLEGTVDVRGVNDSETAMQPLTAGNEMMIFEGSPLPSPTPASPAIMEHIRKESAVGGGEISLQTPQLPEGVASGIVSVDLPYIVPIVEQQQPAVRHQPTDVTIGVKF